MSTFPTILPGVYTSATRPADPFVGEGIFETDTGREMYYYGASLGWLPAWNLQWGEVARFVVTGGDLEYHNGTVQPNQETRDVAQMFVTWTAILGRKYEIGIHGQVLFVGGDTNIGSVAIANRALETNSDEHPSLEKVWNSWPGPIISNWNHGIHMSLTKQGLQGTQTWDQRSVYIHGATSRFKGAKCTYMYASDIGPYQAPVIT